MSAKPSWAAVQACMHMSREQHMLLKYQLTGIGQLQLADVTCHSQPNNQRFFPIVLEVTCSPSLSPGVRLFSSAVLALYL